jgi:hypothetical protein
MILTPIPTTDLPEVLAGFQACLPEGSLAAKVFARIAATWPHPDPATTEPARHAEAVALCAEFGLPTIDEPPQAAFSWDGRAIRVADSEASVVIHEITHYQLCAPARRPLPDFGLGAGPESGRKQEADAALCLPGARRDVEEGLCSLLGILWEAELGHPAILAFLEQNWLEGRASPLNRDHFLKMVRLLHQYGFIDDQGHPTKVLREEDDETFFAELVLD